MPGSYCPHYDGESERRPIYQQNIESGKLSPGMAADDGVALHYNGLNLEQVVSSRPQAKAYRVYLEAEQLREDVISPRYLNQEK